MTGSWSVTTSQLELTELRSSRDGIEFVEMPDRSHELHWLDGKLSIEIDERQYRKY